MAEGRCTLGEDQPTTKRFGKWRRWMGLVLLAVVAALGGAGYYLMRPQRLNRMAEGALEQLTGREAAVGRTELGWDSITLENVSVRIPAGQPNAGRLFHAKRIRLRMHPWSALFGSPHPSTVVFDHPTLYMTEDVDTRTYNYEQLRFSTPARSGGLPSLPTVQLHRGTIRFGEVVHGRYRALGAMHLEGLFHKAAKLPHTFRFILRQVQAASSNGVTARGPKLSGLIDVRHLHVLVTLKRFSFTSPQRDFLPQRVRQWWDRLKPKGSLPTVRVDLRAGRSGGVHLHSAELVVHNVSLTLPWDKRYQPRMTGVSGRFTVEQKQIRVVNLRGRIAGVRYTINGHIDGFAAGAPFQVSAATRKFTVPKQPRYIFALPPVVQKQYHLLSPSGTFKVQVGAMRQRSGGPIEYGGQVQLINAKATFSHFPYPVHDLNGLISFDKNQLRVDHLTGIGPSGARLRMDSGTITPPTIGGRVQMHIEATNMPVDAALLNALQPRQRRAIALFMYKAAYQRLKKAHLLDADNKSPGSFKLGGVIRHVSINIYRPLQPSGHRKPLLATVTLDMKGLQGIFKFWPYPLTCMGGQVTIAPHRITADHVTLRGPTGATGWLGGTVETGSHDSELVPKLTIHEARIPVDPLLLKSIPSPQNQWLRRLGLKGTVVGNGRIYKNTSGQIDFGLHLHIDHGHATPLGSHFTLTNLNAAAILQRSRFLLLAASADHQQARIGARGRMIWPSDGRPLVNVTLGGMNLTLSPALLGLLPKHGRAAGRVRTLVAAHDVAGRFNAALTYDSQRSTAKRYHLALAPISVALNLRGKRLHLTDLHGRITAMPGSLGFESLSGKCGHAAWSATGKMDLPSGNADLSLRASDDRVGELEQTLLPKPVLTALDQLHWRGGYRLNATALHFFPTAKGGQRRLAIDGRLDLIDDALDVGAPITELSGPVSVHVSQRADAASATLRLMLHGGSADAWGRVVAPLSLTLTGHDLLRLTGLRGRVYGGLLAGRGIVATHEGGRYQLQMTLQGAGLEGVLHPAEVATEARRAAAPGARDGDGDDDRGQLSARLSLAGIVGQADRRRGNGLVEVRGARLFDQPLSLALLQAANLSLPTASAFDRASAKMIVQGDQVDFDPLRFEASSLAMAGTGTMTLPGAKLSLRMFCRNPQGPMLGILSQMVNVFKDELVCVQVSGTLSHPQTQNVSLEGIRQTWDQLFHGPRSARRARKVVRSGQGG